MTLNLEMDIHRLYKIIKLSFYNFIDSENLKITKLAYIAIEGLYLSKFRYYDKKYYYFVSVSDIIIGGM